MRKSTAGSVIAVVVNATPVVREAYRIGVSGDGFWEEIINTDAETYGGGNIGNLGGQEAAHTPWQGKSHSLLLRLPPLAVVAFKRRIAVHNLESSPAEPEVSYAPPTEASLEVAKENGVQTQAAEKVSK